MKKRFMALTAFAVVLVMLLSISAFGIESRAAFALPELSFTGKTANCSLYVNGGGRNDSISAVIKLWQGSSCLKTWKASDSGELDFNDTYKVSATGNYKLTADITVNGSKWDQVSTSATCK